MNNKETQSPVLRIAQLEKKLEIEASLERVRVVAMSMRNADDLLNICETMFHELKILGFADLRNAMVNIHYDARDFLLNYDYSGSAGKTITTFKYNSHPIVDNLVYHARQSNEAFTEMVYSGKALDEWRKFRQENNEADDLSIQNVDALYYYFYSIGTGAVGISTFSSANTEQLGILKRFRNVFDLAYGRYVDIANAEAQVLEAQIEASLERVRTIAMGMRKSEEVIDVCETLYKELSALGFSNIRNAQIAINNDERQTYSAFEYADYGATIKEAPYDTHKLLQEIEIEVKQSKEALCEKQITGQELIDWRAWRKRVGLLTDERLEQANAMCFYLYSIGLGMLGISTYDTITADQLETLKRFKNVFALAYRRYTDVSQAEAQAREAQIELAMERIRSRAIAMQKSEELREVIHLIFEQLKQLNFNVNSASLALDYKDNDDFNLWLSSAGQLYPTKVHIPYLDIPIFNRFIEAKQNGVDFLTENYSFEEKNVFFDHFFKNVQGVTDERKAFVMGAAGYAQATVLMKNVTLSMQNYAGIQYSEEENAVLRRFGNVFEQTYTRFLDLQQAEAQAREAQIELALERVRARTMAMQHSDELAETAFILFQQFRELGENPDQATIGIINEAEGVIEYWVTMYGNQSNRVYKFSIDEPNVTSRIYKAWQVNEKSLVIDLSGQELFDFSNYRQSMGGAAYNPEEKRRIINVAFFSKGLINVQSTAARSVASLQLLERFANVFESTYTRFLDLKKAEAQAREAQIELSLERVRAKTMAMYNSRDIDEVVIMLFDELLKLGAEKTIRCGVNILNDARQGEVWSASFLESGETTLTKGFIDMSMHPLLVDIYRAWQNKEPIFSKELAGLGLKNYYEALIASPNYPFEHKIAELPKKQVNNAFFFPEGCLFAFTAEPLSADASRLFTRFANVFGLTYRRFLDLKKAEAQAREAKIETALERVRNRAMAMQKSEDLAHAVAIVFEELDKLNLSMLRCGIGILNKEKCSANVWTTTKSEGETVVQVSGDEPMDIHPLLRQAFDAWVQQDEDCDYVLQGEDLNNFYKALTGTNFKLPGSQSIVTDAMDFKQYYYVATFQSGNLYAFRDTVFTIEAKTIIKRFANVFDFTYTRFNDLKQAEQQLREAQIEASLERVRSKAMAMRNSGDLSAAASTVFTELRNLGINPIRSGVGLIDGERRKAKIYSNTSTQTAADLALMGEVSLVGHPVFEQQYQSWLKRENYFIALGGKDLTSYYKILSAGLNADLGITVKKDQQEYGHWFMFSEGFLYAWSDKAYTDADIKLLERFKNVIELTFRRYIELQKSEAAAREAIRQASLDRVRAEIASMRTTVDLERITPLIWNELTILGVPFIRCGVFIMDEQQQQIHSYLSTPDGKAIAAFQIPFNSDSSNAVGPAALQGWRQKQVVTVHWNEEEFKNFSHALVEQGEIASEENYLTDQPPTSLDLHFFPFLQGMLYAGNIAPLSDDEKDLVQSLADAFSTAYARYEDFNRLEIAKKEVERTLTDLKAAQTRLIQSEKMASLGELTAGIAHEIQNPLNFVNNFSEVNAEMIDELEEELNAGNIEGALAIAADIKQNEQKINQHGKRADGIVKGMLQHSRTAGGEKLPTNINALAEEFMRLSYHGLRAKDKNFNAEMLTHFDPHLPKIQVAGQDIGRVFLNLFNNALYAVNQKKKAIGDGYNPCISVSTSSENGQVIIKVKDNGVGMPEHVKEKIMQPFFTTKPTGEGTGLGLSLTYDMVVKGHGGSIMVNSVEGEGSEFIIALPVV